MTKLKTVLAAVAALAFAAPAQADEGNTLSLPVVTAEFLNQVPTPTGGEVKLALQFPLPNPYPDTGKPGTPQPCDRTRGGCGR